MTNNEPLDCFFFELLNGLFGNWSPGKTKRPALLSLHIVDITLVLVVNVIQTSPGVQIVCV